MTGSRPAGPVALAVLLALSGTLSLGAEPALTLRASAIGAGGAPWTIELLRWSTEAERAPLLATLSAPAAAPPAAPAAAAGTVGRGLSTALGASGRAGRGGRGGRGGEPPPNPLARLAAAVKSAPTLGFLWSNGVTGYSIKYAWRAAASAGGVERIVLVTDRRIDASMPDRPSAPARAASVPTADAEFTLIEMRLNPAGVGDGKMSLDANIVVDSAAQTLALDGYQAAPALLKVTR
jgi:hypothetical protein